MSAKIDACLLRCFSNLCFLIVNNGQFSLLRLLKIVILQSSLSCEAFNHITKEFTKVLFKWSEKKKIGMETEQTPSADEDHAPGKLQDGTCGEIVLSPSKNSFE